MKNNEKVKENITVKPYDRQKAIVKRVFGVEL